MASDESFSDNTFEDVLKKITRMIILIFLKTLDIFFEDDDITIVNFEGTLSNNGERQDKEYAFRGKPDYVNILKKGSVEAVTLANNHSEDYGPESLKDTKKTLYDSDIKYALNTETAHFNIRGAKVGIIGLYQLDGSAGEVLPSAMSKIENDDLKIVQVHWGEEKSDTPSDEASKSCAPCYRYGRRFGNRSSPSCSAGN